jgi:hypothetical protein
MVGEPKKLGYLLDLSVSSLRRGHANLLCIVPILADDPEGFQQYLCLKLLKASNQSVLTLNGLI